MKYLFILIFCFSTNLLIAQTVTGKITDAKTGEDLIGANIVFVENGQYKVSVSTDFDGNYTVEVKEGIYDVEVSYIGYPPNLITDVVVASDKPNLLNIKLGGGGDGIDLSEVITLTSDNLIIWENKTTSGTVINVEEIRNLPTKKINEFTLLSPGISTKF